MVLEPTNGLKLGSDSAALAGPGHDPKRMGNTWRDVKAGHVRYLGISWHLDQMFITFHDLMISYASWMAHKGRGIHTISHNL